jgi:hypothetical protein
MADTKKGETHSKFAYTRSSFIFRLGSFFIFFSPFFIIIFYFGAQHNTQLSLVHVYIYVHNLHKASEHEKKLRIIFCD